jgi:hypothetical protein
MTLSCARRLSSDRATYQGAQAVSEALNISFFRLAASNIVRAAEVCQEEVGKVCGKAEPGEGRIAHLGRSARNVLLAIAGPLLSGRAALKLGIGYPLPGLVRIE